MNLSDHFTLHEFTVSRIAAMNEIDNTAAPALILPLMELCDSTLEPIRKQFGSVTITSGYRCRELNRAVGSSDNSQHVKGEAADIIVSTADTYHLCKWIADSLIPFDQLIFEGHWCHISYGDRMRRSVLTARFRKGHKTEYLPGIIDA